MEERRAGSPVDQIVTRRDGDVVGFDAFTFAQEILRQSREIASCSRVDGCLKSLEAGIKEWLSALQECPTFAGREKIRVQMMGSLRARRDVLLKMVVDKDEMEILSAEITEVLRAVGAVGMAFL